MSESADERIRRQARERQQRARDRRKAEGAVEVRVRCHPDDAEKIREFARGLRND